MDEVRTFAIEYRAEGDKRKIRGYAAVFNKMSDVLGGFREKIAPGAFKKTLKEADVRALFNHDPNIILGRTKAGTLILREDETGLWMEIDPPDTPDARGVMTLIERGDVNQASFAFQVVKDTWVNEESEMPVRTLDEVRLFDVSPVTYPAYPQTTVDVRALATRALLNYEETHTPEPENHSEPEPREHSEEPVDHSEAEPSFQEGHSEEVKIRPRSLLFQEWRLAMEADAQIRREK